jgi:hypothetical protein
VNVETHINSLREQIKIVRENIKQHIDNNPDLKKKSELLRLIPTIGETTTSQVLAFIGDTNKFNNAKELSAF